MLCLTIGLEAAEPSGCGLKVQSNPSSLTVSTSGIFHSDIKLTDTPTLKEFA
jgi:hypothetical protein